MVDHGGRDAEPYGHPRQAGRGTASSTDLAIFFPRPKLLTLLLLLPPLLWIGIVYVGSLFALLLQSFYSLDDFSGLIVHEFTLSTYAQLFEEANRPDHPAHGRDVGARHDRLRGHRVS